MVDGKPFLMLAGELNNTISSDPESMRTVWPALARRGHLNTVLTGVAWNWIEPAEGKYDFHFVDEAIRGAQQAMFAWCCFGSAVGRTRCRALRRCG